MPGFLYFKPQFTAQVTLDHVKEWGLDYAFTSSPAGCVCMGETPTRTPGVVFGEDSRHKGRAITMNREQQAWAKLPGSDVHVGYWLEAKPTPTDLARVVQLPGFRVRLADEQDWLIPLVRRFDAKARKTVSNLPCYMGVSDDGKWSRARVVAAHAHLWDVTAPIADALLGEYVDGTPVDVPDDQIFGAVVDLIKTNYVAGAGELSLMEALTNEANTHAAVLAACDWLTFREWAAELDAVKKNADEPVADGSTMFVGEKV